MILNEKVVIYKVLYLNEIYDFGGRFSIWDCLKFLNFIMREIQTKFWVLDYFK